MNCCGASAAVRNEMRVLLDTDVFCKLAVGRVLNDAVRLLGVDLVECGRLPALPYMLRKGRLRKLYGPETCDALIPLSNAIPKLVQPSEDWLDRLAPIEEIDPGEALLLASAAEHGMLVISGDKRALRALRDVNEFPSALAGRIIALEAILMTLCEDLGADEVSRRVRPLTPTDEMVRICFSNPADTDPVHCLQSYLDHLAIEVSPLVLWDASFGGTA